MPPARVLVVDDQQENRDLLREVLEDHGLDVSIATTGQEAVDFVSRFKPDLVLLDILMPGIDGVEACRLMRELPGRVALPIVFVTALDDVESRIRAKESGGDDFLTKPINLRELMALVRTQLKAKAYVDKVEGDLGETKARLLHADRLATVGQLACGVAHELKNISAIVSSAAGEIRRHIAEGTPIDHTIAGDLATAAQHVSHFGYSLMALGRPAASHEEPVDLCELIAATTSLLQKSGRVKFLPVLLALPAEPLTVFANRTEVQQIILNLVGNAADAFAGRSDSRSCIRISVRALNGRAFVMVSDNASGMTPDTMARIFEPYFTTKPPDKGNGLGLPVVRQIVESYGGEIRVESSLGKGTTIALDLPLTERDRAVAK